MLCNKALIVIRMSFLNSIGNWFQNHLLKFTYDPAADALKQVYNASFQTNLGGLQSTVANIGGGLGGFITSVPGISGATQSAYGALEKAAKDALDGAKSMTPGQIAQKNDELQAEHDRIAAQANTEAAKAAAKAKEDEEELKKTPIEDLETFKFDRFLKKVFDNFTYMMIFFLVLALAFLGSSLAANAAIHEPIPFRIYYMIYGFILFPISIAFGINNFFQKKKLFYAFWAPLHKGSSSNPLLNVLLLPFIYSAHDTHTVSNLSGKSLVTHHGHHKTIPAPAPATA